MSRFKLPISLEIGIQNSSQVFLIGCGLGDVELLTIKAYNCIQTVDVILYDYLISEEIMQIVPPSTVQIYVGKEKDNHSKPQEEINALILEYVKKGYTVARLKSGDPFIFGRGAEELLYLTQEGIKTEVIPGISSSISAPLMANIPVTARGYASSFTVVSAHLKGSKINLDWIDLLHKKNHTVVVLMGLSCIEKIVKEAKNQGVELSKPAAIISNASRANQSVQLCTLQSVEEKALDALKPAILVFGDVVHYLKVLNTTSTHRAEV